MEIRDRVRLQHMLEAAEEAMEFVHGREREDLQTDLMLARALVASLGIVGEAARQVSQETRRQYPSVPWQDIVGMRNRLVHEYFDINYDVVWQTVKIELPKLVDALEQREF